MLGLLLLLLLVWVLDVGTVSRLVLGFVLVFFRVESLLGDRTLTKSWFGRVEAFLTPATLGTTKRNCVFDVDGHGRFIRQGASHQFSDGLAGCR